MANAFELKAGTLTPGQRVRVHLHISQTRRLGRPVWSVSGPSGPIICHTDAIAIACEGFKVAASKLARVAAGGKKEVCLWAVGTIVATTGEERGGTPVSVSPLHPDLALLPDGTPYRGGGILSFTSQGMRPLLSR